MKQKSIWTIGHSTRTFDDFLAMLRSFQIDLVVDVRRYPGSRRYPQFNSDDLKKSLDANGIGYVHMEQLGGRRKPLENSHNTAWRLASFKGYADYMETANFQQALGKLEGLATTNKVAFMCSEAVWWSCHRSLIADALKFRGWLVFHIMGINKSVEHPYTKPAQIKDNRLVYEPV